MENNEVLEFLDLCFQKGGDPEQFSVISIKLNAHFCISLTFFALNRSLTCEHT